jgi:chromosome partitioning protein
MGKPLKVWILLTRFNTRRRLSKTVLVKLLDYFPRQVLATVIRENAPVAESPGYGQSVIEYSPHSNGAKDYRALADDISKLRTFKA